MLTLNPEERITAAEAFADPWIEAYASQVPKKITGVTSMSLKNLRNFKVGLGSMGQVKTKLQQAVMAYIASHLQGQDKQDKLRAAFREFDKNGDGVLSRAELIEGYKQIGYKSADAVVAVDGIMDKIDINKNGNIEYDEFLMANIDKDETLSQEKLKQAFKIFDKVETVSNP
jgi:calcium-dependent protein kinase